MLKTKEYKMRKITKEAVCSFINGLNYKKGNTEVSNREGMVFFYLHGNCIATLKEDELYLSHCGWLSTTTKERLNGILNAYNLGSICQKNFQWYLNGILFEGSAIVNISK